MQRINNNPFKIIYCNGVEPNDNDEQVISSAFGKITVFSPPTDQEKVCHQFANFLREKITKSVKKSKVTILIAYSHGALITKKALELLQPSERNTLRIYTFGGVVMIPKNLGSFVKNYVFKEDTIAINENLKYDSEKILDKTLKFSFKKEGKIIAQFLQDNSEATEEFEERRKKYMAFRYEYNIIILLKPENNAQHDYGNYHKITTYQHWIQDAAEHEKL